MPELNLENYSDLIIGLLTLLVGLSIRDWATSFVKGARFRFDPSFAEGDKVILDDQQAMIIKIGLNTTVFGVYGDDLHMAFCTKRAYCYAKIREDCRPRTTCRYKTRKGTKNY